MFYIEQHIYIEQRRAESFIDGNENPINPILHTMIVIQYSKVYKKYVKRFSNLKIKNFVS